jgi:hypothetical protein
MASVKIEDKCMNSDGEINQGIRILAARIRSNPDEFIDDTGRMLTRGRWRDITDMISIRRDGRHNIFTQEELELVDSALYDVARERFAAKVMSQLFADDEHLDDWTTQYENTPSRMCRGVSLLSPPVPASGGLHTKNTGR